MSELLDATYGEDVNAQWAAMEGLGAFGSHAVVLNRLAELLDDRYIETYVLAAEVLLTRCGERGLELVMDELVRRIDDHQSWYIDLKIGEVAATTRRDLHREAFLYADRIDSDVMKTIVEELVREWNGMQEREAAMLNPDGSRPYRSTSAPLPVWAEMPRREFWTTGDDGRPALDERLSHFMLFRLKGGRTPLGDFVSITRRVMPHDCSIERVAEVIEEFVQRGWMSVGGWPSETRIYEEWTVPVREIMARIADGYDGELGYRGATDEELWATEVFRAKLTDEGRELLATLGSPYEKYGDPYLVD